MGWDCWRRGILRRSKEWFFWASFLLNVLSIITELVSLLAFIPLSDQKI
jgi:hypothetical protein